MNLKNNPFIDLFARCGGLSLGMEKTGFTPVFANVIWDVAEDEIVFNAKTQRRREGETARTLRSQQHTLQTASGARAKAYGIV